MRLCFVWGASFVIYWTSRIPSDRQGKHYLRTQRVWNKKIGHRPNSNTLFLANDSWHSFKWENVEVFLYRFDSGTPQPWNRTDFLILIHVVLQCAGLCPVDDWRTHQRLISVFHGRCKSSHFTNPLTERTKVYRNLDFQLGIPADFAVQTSFLSLRGETGKDIFLSPLPFAEVLKIIKMSNRISQLPKTVLNWKLKSSNTRNTFAIGLAIENPYHHFKTGLRELLALV